MTPPPAMDCISASPSSKPCLLCHQHLSSFMSFGKQPIANGFLIEQDFAREYFYEMRVGFCERCGAFQLMEQPSREQMFNENYAFFSGTSQTMALHFKKFSEQVHTEFLTAANPFVVEIGCNDGTMLRNFKASGIRQLGIDPSANVVAVAKAQGIDCMVSFFDRECAEKIVAERGQADAFIAANVMCHIPYLHSIVEGISLLVKKGGVAIFEDPYLGDVIRNTTYDQIYDEHTFLFSLQSIQYIFSQHGMELFHVEPQESHGGSMRYFLAHKGTRAASAALQEWRRRESEMGLDRPETYQTFARNCDRYRADLVQLVRSIRAQGKRIVGYAATSKSTTILNYCGLTAADIEFISDTTPIKQGKFSPGAHIPVKSHDAFAADYPDYALLFGYNHAKEIMAKESAFMAAGGKWLIYFPEVKVLT